MDKAVKHTAPPVGEESPDLEALLKAGSFQQRLEQARIRREQALAESGRDPEKELSGLTKPWERADYARAEKQVLPRLQPRPSAKNGPRLKGPFDGPSVTAAPEIKLVAVPVVKEVEVAPPVASTPATSGFPIMRSMFGFGLGLSLGAAIAWSFGQFGQQPTVQSPSVVEAPAMTSQSASATDASEVAAAVPAAEPAGVDEAVQLAAVSDPQTPFTTPELVTSNEAAESAPSLPVTPVFRPFVAAEPIPSPLGLLPTEAADLPDIEAVSSANASSSAPMMLASVVAPDQPLPAQSLPPVMSIPGVEVHVFVPTSGTELDTKALAEEVSNAGFQVTGPASVPYTIKKTHVRYYHAEDADAAKALAKKMGTNARDFTGKDAPPPVGHLELWLAGIEPVAQAPAPVKTTKKAKAPPAEAKAPLAPMPEDVQMQILRDRILSQLN